ncbi:hypothetical protein Pfo_007839 [Paulownia fortunei]|nr:hypothetical protein Pfo_007839 [Paulownia fortunei]
MREADNAYTEYIPDAEPDDANDPIADSFGPNIPSDSEPDEVEHPIPNDNEDDVDVDIMLNTLSSHGQGTSSQSELPVSAAIPSSSNEHILHPSIPFISTTYPEHRSEIVMTWTIDEILHGRRADGPFWQLFDQVHPHARVLTILHHMGFYGVYRCGRFIADYHLITTLVERWRRETHTFHFRVGEATITLQDVAVIWGLPIDGRPVTGVDHEMSIPQWMQYCEVTLGFHLAPEHFRGARLYTTALAQHMRQHHVTDDSDEEHVHQYTRACAFMLFGGVMCPDSSGNSIPLLYLPKFENVDEVSGYSWGSAVLAFLYRELCTACSKTKCNIGGALQLLQIWVWSRITPITPVVLESRVDLEPWEIDLEHVLPNPPMVHGKKI